MVSTPSNVIAFIFALTAFAIAIVAGMAAGDSTEHVLGRAIIVLFVCQLVGRILGSLVTHVLNEYLRRYETDRPVPEVPSRIQGAASATGGGVSSSGGLSSGGVPS